MSSPDTQQSGDPNPRARAAAGVSPTRREEGIALCLSGGGFRASLFHLGALRRLHEIGVLQRLAAISSVSGGSIFSAFLATRLHQLGRRLSQGFANWQTELAEPFRAFCSRDFRTLPILAHVLWNWIWPDPLVRHLERRYRRRLTGLALKDLPAVPRFTLCASDLTFGVNWEFTRDEAGDYQAGYLADGAEWLLARAVAASACFPPLFGPLSIRAAPDGYRRGKYAGPDGVRLRGRIQLSDGGVYDNMGLEPVWKEWSHVLISDCGAPFDFRLDTAPIRRLLRYTAVVTSQTRALRLRAFFGDTSAGRYQGAYWSLMSGVRPAGARAGEPAYVGYSQELTDEVLERIRTDLDSFSQPEMSVLENHGYWAAERSIRKYQPGLVPGGSPAAASPYPEWVDEGKVRTELRDSHKRIALRRVLRGLGMVRPGFLRNVRSARVALAAIVLGGCGKSPVTLVPVPDEENRVEVRTGDPGWERRVGDLTACVLRVDRAAECARTPNPPVCDTRTREEALRLVQPIVDSLPKVRLTNRFEMNQQLRNLFPSATPSTEVIDARRRTSCADWSGGACAAIRTDEVALVFEGNPGGIPERIQIFRISPACRESRPDGETRQ